MNHIRTEKWASWWQVALFGAGCTIGIGFFLGSSIAIQKSGVFIFIIYLLAAISTWFVHDALAQLTIHFPQKGSFRSFARNAFGRWAGFAVGWIYWFSEILILGSTLIAIGLFTQVWFPDIPLWLLSAGYSFLGLAILILGTRGINQTENLFAVIKIAAIIMFIIVAIISLFKDSSTSKSFSTLIENELANGWKGAWQGLLYAFYAYGGIEVMGFMETNLKDVKEATKVGRSMIGGITLLYISSLALILLIVPIHQLTQDRSPFISVLELIHASWFAYILNGVFVVAGFSILVASLYAASTTLVSLAEDRDGPSWIKRKVGKREHPIYAYILNALGLCSAVLLALLIPKEIFLYLITAGGLVLLYIWLIILFSYLRLFKEKEKRRVETLKTWSAIFLIVLAFSGSMLEPSGRIGFWISLGIVLSMVLITFLVKRAVGDHAG
ncbi:amino acid permease [Bacillus horti]|uniref:L-asparagine transporter-like permease n=1 Tax=Caldalkalibacillus horti TaxID=77523 RepID=A0ABT9VY10_9BACI|nr:amino acid permease [Bacillus horti]MDQ0165879.1 L-asparagine transporter-like permease [Bacillus horti]